MRRRTLKAELNVASIQRTIRELQNRQKWVERKTDELLERLAQVGAQEATVRFVQAKYDGRKDAYVSVEPTANGWVIRAQGGSVFFIEFGAGVYYNGAGNYPGGRPAKVKGIGEYGLGRGKQPMWGYYDDAGSLVLTRGNPAAMPMYHARREMERSIKTIAQEVFGT